MSQDAFANNGGAKLRSDTTERGPTRGVFAVADVFFTCVQTDICPEDIPPSEGLSALNSLFEAKMGHGVARLLDTLFDILVN